MSKFIVPVSCVAGVAECNDTVSASGGLVVLIVAVLVIAFVVAVMVWRARR